MAPNPIVLAKSNEVFPSIKFTFTTWLTGSIAPAMVCALCLPLILGVLILGRTLGAKHGYNDAIIAHSKQELKAMGSMTIKEMVKMHFRRDEKAIDTLYSTVAAVHCLDRMSLSMGDICVHKIGAYFSGVDWYFGTTTYGHHCMD